MTKESTRLHKRQDRTASITPIGGKKSAAIEHTDISATSIDEIVETSENFDKESSQTNGLTHYKVRKFINRVLSDNGLQIQELGLIYDVGRSSVSNWKYLGLNSDTGYPNVDALNHIAFAHALPLWAIIRCIELEEVPPPIKNYSQAYNKVVKLATQKDVKSDTLIDMAKLLARLGEKARIAEQA